MAVGAARSVLKRLALAVSLVLAPGPLAAVDDQPGDFDFYVLALTWSPSYCANARRPDPEQCDLSRSSFNVHGLWPQFERGYPEDCRSTPYGLTRSDIASISDVMPSGKEAAHAWNRHGTCSGLRPKAYFDLLRRAVAAVTIPTRYRAPETAIATSPRTIEADFLAANPGLSERGFALSCSRQGVLQARICLTKRLQFRRCADVDRLTCRAPVVTLEPAR
ncbi:ribonuclease T2 family protein [Bauldia sp.]|uniref:ribonuclease T2 family protein n=1 Tax=Bauldia sp. TaxID=2575872 RepID=UPI003BAADE88